MKYIFRGIGLVSSISLFILGLAVIIYAFVEGARVIHHILDFSASEANVISEAMSILDLILLSFSVFITSIGIFELFVYSIPDLPDWLQIKNFDALKGTLIKVIVVVMGISFMGRAVTWDGQKELLGYGIANGIIILALSYFLNSKKNHESQ
ncbi:YqhA family protein [Ulvibacterium sp.]|uniref:YqhA family protein n=1 Tax=Ulvibacterium sp. TaxID=2665914 RepID=UPI003CC66EE2